MDFDRGQLPFVDEPWGFSGGKRQIRNVQADSRVFYVDPNNALAKDESTGEDPAFPLLTITQAVTNCRAYKGDTIFVVGNDGWTYGSATSNPIVESVIIPATKPGIKLIGVGGGPLGVYWQPGAAGETCLDVRAIDVTVMGFAFFGNGSAADGIYCEWDGATLFGENLTVAYCSFDEDIDTAIQLEFAWFCNIHHCRFIECDVYGIWTDVAGSGCAYCEIHHNVFMELLGTAAIALLGGSDNNDIHHNHIFNSNAQAAAVATNEGINLTGGDENLVHHNTLSCLLPVPANGDYDDFCTAAAGDSWVQNYCMDGPSVTNPT